MLGHTQDNASFILNLLLLIPTEKALLKNFDSTFPTYNLIGTVSICWNKKPVNYFTIFSFMSLTNFDNTYLF